MQRVLDVCAAALDARSYLTEVAGAEGEQPLAGTPAVPNPDVLPAALGAALEEAR